MADGIYNCVVLIERLRDTGYDGGIMDDTYRPKDHRKSGVTLKPPAQIPAVD